VIFWKLINYDAAHVKHTLVFWYFWLQKRLCL